MQYSINVAPKNIIFL